MDVDNNDSDNDDVAEDEELDADEERQAAVDMLTIVNQDLAQARGEPAKAAKTVETSSAMLQASKLGEDFLSGVVPRLVANNLLGAWWAGRRGWVYGTLAKLEADTCVGIADQFKDDVGLYQQVLDVFRLFPGTRASRGMVWNAAACGPPPPHTASRA